MAAQPVQQAAPAFDLSPLIQRLDAIGQGMNVSVKGGEEAKAAVAALGQDVANLHALVWQSLAALHHLYVSHPSLGPATQGKANTLPEFQQFLAGYLPK